MRLATVRMRNFAGPLAGHKNLPGGRIWPWLPEEVRYWERGSVIGGSTVYVKLGAAYYGICSARRSDKKIGNIAMSVTE